MNLECSVSGAFQGQGVEQHCPQPYHIPSKIPIGKETRLQAWRAPIAGSEGFEVWRPAGWARWKDWRNRKDWRLAGWALDGLKDWQIGRLEDWKIERLEDWKIGRRSLTRSTLWKRSEDMYIYIYI